MRNILTTLPFVVKYPGWHTFQRPLTVRAVRSLEKRGFVEVSGDQFRWTGKVY